jgi:hypothetical protein
VGVLRDGVDDGALVGWRVAVGTIDGVVVQVGGKEMTVEVGTGTVLVGLTVAVVQLTKNWLANARTSITDRRCRLLILFLFLFSLICLLYIHLDFLLINSGSLCPFMDLYLLDI